METKNVIKLPPAQGQASNVQKYAQTRTTPTGLDIPDVVTVKDQKPDCYCGKPAVKLTSHTNRNPDRFRTSFMDRSRVDADWNWFPTGTSTDARIATIARVPFSRKFGLSIAARSPSVSIQSSVLKEILTGDFLKLF